jgi:hypothetical protein
MWDAAVTTVANRMINMVRDITSSLPDWALPDGFRANLDAVQSQITNDTAAAINGRAQDRAASSAVDDRALADAIASFNTARDAAASASAVGLPAEAMGEVDTQIQQHTQAAAGSFSAVALGGAVGGTDVPEKQLAVQEKIYEGITQVVRAVQDGGKW